MGEDLSSFFAPVFTLVFIPPSRKSTSDRLETVLISAKKYHSMGPDLSGRFHKNIPLGLGRLIGGFDDALDLYRVG